jgi:hypothetical protein
MQSSGSALRRSVNAHKLLRCGLSAAQLTVDQESARAADLVREYFEAFPLGKGLPDLELQPVDDLAILAAQVYTNMFSLDNTVAHLHNAVVVLEYASRKSPQSYQVHLELVRVYRLLGMFLYFQRTSSRRFTYLPIRRAAACFGPLSSYERETSPERYYVVLDSFSCH